MHIDEIADHFGISKWTIHRYRRLGAIDPPRGYGRWASWPESVLTDIRKIREIAHDDRVTIGDIGENRLKYLGKR